MTERSSITSARRIVIKIGSAALTGGGDQLDRAYMHDLAAQFADAITYGREVILVSSGAVAAGVKTAGLGKRPTDVAGQQAAAAAGQPLLMARWHEAFGVRSRGVAQILVSRTDFDSRDRFLNMRNCIHCLLELGVVPIINENDTVATEEISLGDNDVLAAKLATAVLADALIILSTAGGVMDDRNQLIPSAPDAESLRRYVRADKSGQGRGGMTTKLEAARVASLVGIPTIIAPGRPAGVVGDLLRGDPVGTYIGQSIAPADVDRRAGRRVWIALTATPAGTIDVDDGAANAITQRGASLLAKGVRGATGRFEVGDVVAVRGPSGEVARGLTNVSSDELRLVMGKDSRDFDAILGRQSHAEVIHRDNLVTNPRTSV